MHFVPQRPARAVEAPSPGITQVTVHRQCLPSSTSELIYTGDSHMEMISERRSTPCLRLPASKSFQRYQSRSDASAIERPDSRASTVSPRRSVTRMKHLLPFRLQPTSPQPKVDLASWLDNTSLNLEPEITFNFESESEEELTGPIPIPWISSSQDVPLSRNLPPGRYRETPIYSDSGSPVLCRAHFSDEESGYHCSSKGSVCDELCIISDYDDAQTPNSHSQPSILDYMDTFDADLVGSMETPTTSFSSSRVPDLSSRCHGEYVHPDEATWVKSSFRLWIEGRVYETASKPRTNEIEQEQNSFEGWLDSESSRSSSIFSNDEVLDALATKIAPAKAHVVELSKILPNTIPNLADPPKSHLQGRPTTPYRLSRRRRTLVNYPLPALKKSSFEDGTPRQRQQPAVSPSSSVVCDLHCEHTMHSPISSHIANISFHDYEERFLGLRHSNSESDSVIINRSIVDSINDIVRGFPQHMPFLDTPCIVELRRQNHFAHDATAAQHLSIPLPNSSTYSLPLDQLQRPLRRRRTTAKLLEPLLHASLAKSFLPQNNVASSYVTPPSSRRSTDSRRLSLSDPPPPDLSAFQHIFPSTQDWWRTVLYAHLIAYNYICANLVRPQYAISEVPPKASRTLGISQGLSSDSTAVPVSDAILGEIEMGLLSCITWIANCMAGKNNAQTDTKKVRNVYERDHILVSALAEIVRVCETNSCGEVQNSEFH